MKKISQYIFFVFIIGAGLGLQGCSTVRTIGQVAQAVGKVGWVTAKVTGKATVMTGKIAVKTGKVTSKGVRTAVYIARGKQVIPLQIQGNSLYADVILNKKFRARFLVDTGASKMQISHAMARELKINVNKGEPTVATLAGGMEVAGRVVNIRRVQVGRVKIKNIQAIVLEHDQMGLQDGLLGMSFLNHFIFKIDIKRRQLILEQRVVDK